MTYLPKKFKLKQLIILILIISLVGSLALKKMYTVKSVGRLMAYKEWALIHLESEKLISKKTGNHPTQLSQFELFQFDRDDFFGFEMNRTLRAGQHVNKGTIAAKLFSTENQFQLQTLLGQLEETKAELKLLQTGEKKPIIQEVKQLLEYAKTQYDNYRSIIERKRELFQKKLLSQEQLENAEADFKLQALNVSIAEAKLKSVQTGEKPEMHEMIQKQIETLQSQIDAIQTKLAAETIRIPIDGTVMSSLDESVLCQVAQLDTMLIQIPVEEKYIRYLKPGYEIQVRALAHNDRLYSGRLLSIGKKAEVINGQMKFILIGEIANPDSSLLPGMSGYVKIICDYETLLTHLKRAWQHARGSKFFF